MELVIANSLVVHEVVRDGRADFGIAAKERAASAGVLREIPFVEDEVVVAGSARPGAHPDCLPETCRLENGTSVETLLEKGQNTMIAMDSSGSMAGPAGGRQTKLEAAKEAVGRYARTAPPALDRLGFLASGHRGPSEAQKEESCRGSEVPAPIGEFGRSGDPVASARRLNRSGVRVTVDVVGFDIGSSTDVERLRQWPRPGAGSTPTLATGTTCAATSPASSTSAGGWPSS